MTDTKASLPRAVFFGTPEFSVACLDALTKVATVVGVVCQPDRPKGRGLTLTAPPVKVRAVELGLPVVQPTKLRSGEFPTWLAAQNIDIAIVVAYGRILPKALLETPRLGCLNVHASLLPELRGAAPIVWAIVRGFQATGVTLMQMDEGMDTGAMLEKRSIEIFADETADALSTRLSRLGAELIGSELPRFLRGELNPIAQEDSRATTAPMLDKSIGLVDFTMPALVVHNHIRGMSPWPGAFTTLETSGVKKIIKLRQSQRSGISSGSAVEGSEARQAARPGEVVFADKSRVMVACGKGIIELVEIQLEGKKPMRASDWYLGRGIKEGSVFGV
jgi:methionyl-tRNA formyltransferase